MKPYPLEDPNLNQTLYLVGVGLGAGGVELGAEPLGVLYGVCTDPAFFWMVGFNRLSFQTNTYGECEKGILSVTLHIECYSSAITWALKKDTLKVWKNVKDAIFFSIPICFYTQ